MEVIGKEKAVATFTGADHLLFANELRVVVNRHLKTHITGVDVDP